MFRDVTWCLTQEEYAAVQALVKATQAMCRPSATHKNRYLDPTARIDTPPPAFCIPEPPFEPIFSRIERPGAGKRFYDAEPKGYKSMKDLPSMILPSVEVDEMDLDVRKENMIIVDGWRKYPLPQCSIY